MEERAKYSDDWLERLKFRFLPFLYRDSLIKVSVCEMKSLLFTIRISVERTRDDSRRQTPCRFASYSRRGIERR